MSRIFRSGYPKLAYLVFGAEEVQDFGLEQSAKLLLGKAQRIHWYSLYDLPRAWPATTRHREAEGSSYYRHFLYGPPPGRWHS